MKRQKFSVYTFVQVIADIFFNNEKNYYVNTTIQRTSIASY